jgi:hypothetical protein
VTFPKVCSVMLLVATLSIAANPEPRTVGVCEALDSIGDHQTVAIRATLSLNRHGTFLVEGTGNDPCPGWPSHFFTAPSAIPVFNGPGFDVRVPGVEVQRTLDILVKLRNAHIANPSRTFSTTLNGVLIRKRWSLIVRYPDGTYHGDGFGPASDCAALLVVTSVLRVR